jgi:midasin (ATPase involved in ribosome maturation)
LSIRDILSIIEFLQVTVDKVFKMDISAAFKHAVSLVIIDGLCLGIDVSGDK